MSDPSLEPEVVVVGGGPAGYVCAIRAAQLGFRTACVERRGTLGGTCLNIGCIPSKALLDSSELFDQVAHQAAAHGIVVPPPQIDVAAMLRRKDSVVSILVQGVAGLFRKHRIEWIRGSARFTSPETLQVTGEEGAVRTVHAPHFVVATGSVPVALPFAPFDEDRILSSTGALQIPEVPAHLVIIGGGVIGMELGSVWLRLGAKVTVLEALPAILPGLDSEIVRAASAAYRKQGFELRTGVRVEGVQNTGSGVQVQLAGGESIEADRLLVAVGRRPFADGLGLEELGVRRTDRGAVVVDEAYHTGVGGIRAVGDLIGGAMLAHKAMEEGVAVAEILAGQPARVEYEAIANVVYTAPEIASLGKTEDALRQEGRAIRTGVFPFLANGRARAMGDSAGMVKVIADADTGRLLGLHILGPRASELASEGSLARAFEANIEDIALTPHAHPTLSEAIHEAALAALGRPLHI